MEDIKNIAQNEHNSEHKEPKENKEGHREVDNEKGQHSNEEKKQQQDDVQKEVEKEQKKGEEQQQVGQFNDFDRFEDYREQPQVHEGQRIKNANVQNEQESQAKPEQGKVEQLKNIQEPSKDIVQEIKTQNKVIIQQNNQKSPKKQRVEKEEDIRLSPNKQQEGESQDIPQKIKESAISGSIVLRQAQKERIGSIFQNFRKFHRQYEQIVGSYKSIIKNVIDQLKRNAAYKSNLQNTLVEYFQNYSKIHRELDQKVFKLAKAAKEEHPGTTNKYLNMKQYLKSGFQQLSELRKNIGMNNQKLDGYINNYVIKSITQVFQDYRDEIAGEEKRQLSQKQDFVKQEKSFRKVVQNLDKLCKKGIEGVKNSEDIFVQLSNYINKERGFRKVLIRYGKTVIPLRKNYVNADIKLFEKLQKILNQFKNQQKMVYVAAKEFNFIQDFANCAQEKAKYQNLCTITDADYIKGVLKLQNRKERTKFQNSHFEEYLDMPFIDPFISEAKKMLKGAIKKSFPLRKENIELVHTISQNLIEYDRGLNECHQKMVIRHLNANIIGEGAIEFSEMIKKVIFTEHRTIRIQLQSADRAQELISYLNEMQQLGKN